MRPSVTPTRRAYTLTAHLTHLTQLLVCIARVAATRASPHRRPRRLARTELTTTADLPLALKQRIPAGAGLGGGSTDAAAVLKALPTLAGRQIPLDRLTHLAAKLGSDVPFFLNGGPALGPAQIVTPHV